MIANEYKINPQFKKRVLYFVKEYAKIRKKILTKKDEDRLSAYIISELPTLINGIEYDGESYQLILYPTYVSSGMSEFVLDIQKGKYSNLIKKIKSSNNGKMIESYLCDFK